VPKEEIITQKVMDQLPASLFGTVTYTTMVGTMVEADSIRAELRLLALQNFTSLKFLNLGLTTCAYRYYDRHKGQNFYPPRFS